MPPDATINDPCPLRQEIESLINRLATLPADVALHQQLRETALRHKAAGGRDLGILEKCQPLPKDSLQRLLHIERLWAFDPNNIDRAVELLLAVDRHAASRSDADFDAVSRWLEGIVQVAQAGA